jgi:hypothetical protein
VRKGSFGRLRFLTRKLCDLEDEDFLRENCAIWMMKIFDENIVRFCFVGLVAGLPDGFFSDKKSLLGYIWEDLGMENVVILYFTSIFLAFAHFIFIWYIFPRFNAVYQEKSGNPGWWPIFEQLEAAVYYTKVSITILLCILLNIFLHFFLFSTV